MSTRIHAPRRIWLLLLVVTFVWAPQVHAAEDRIHMSNNWSGHEALNGVYTGVSATWVVPKASKSTDDISAHAVWVGIGGATTKDLVQAGTQAIVISGKTYYHAWYETLPDPERELPLSVQPGDTVSVSLIEVVPDVWRLTFVNITTGATYIGDIPYTSTRSSAEWIVERPMMMTSAGKEYITLNAFDEVEFTSATVIENGVTRSLGQLDTKKVVLKGKNATTVSSVPSKVKNNAFTVSYYTPAQGRKYMRGFRKVRTTVPEKEQETMPSTITSPLIDTKVIQINAPLR
jgi:hypothetical protein